MTLNKMVQPTGREERGIRKSERKVCGKVEETEDFSSIDPYEYNQC
jgi:hypothetical protein